MGICVAINVLIFLAFPAYCSYRSVRQFEAQLDGIRTALPQLGSPNDLLILGFDSHFLGYRHAGYYLPNYLTLEYPEVKLSEGTRIFAMQGQDTRLLASLPSGSYKRFVVFPLPGTDGEYQQYLETFKKLLPAQDLAYVDAGGQKFVTGPISDLPLLFPHAAKVTR
jgi:hypothetical protein